MASFIWRVSSYGRTAPGISGAYIPGKSQSFAVVFRAAVAVVLKQRNGVVISFWTAKGRLQTRQLHSAKRTVAGSLLSSTPPVRTLATVYRRRRADFFAASTEDAAPKINSQASSPVARSVSTVKAFDGRH